MSDKYSIIRAASVEPSENLTRLFSEVSGEPANPDVQRINSLIAEGKLAFYQVLDDSGKIMGMASVVPYHTAVADKLWIEDVCILSDCRGAGLGRKLMEFLLADAADHFGGGTFWLTSRPSRTAARTLYHSLGFSEYDTGVFYK